MTIESHIVLPDDPVPTWAEGLLDAIGASGWTHVSPHFGRVPLFRVIRTEVLDELIEPQNYNCAHLYDVDGGVLTLWSIDKMCSVGLHSRCVRSCRWITIIMDGATQECLPEIEKLFRRCAEYMALVDRDTVAVFDDVMREDSFAHIPWLSILREGGKLPHPLPSAVFLCDENAIAATLASNQQMRRGDSALQPKWLVRS